MIILFSQRYGLTFWTRYKIPPNMQKSAHSVELTSYTSINGAKPEHAGNIVNEWDTPTDYRKNEINSEAEEAMMGTGTSKSWLYELIYIHCSHHNYCILF